MGARVTREVPVRVSQAVPLPPADGTLLCLQGPRSGWIAASGKPRPLGLCLLLKLQSIFLAEAEDTRLMLLLPTTPRGPLSPASACLLLRCCSQQHLQELEGAVSILFLLKRGFLVTSVSF